MAETIQSLITGLGSACDKIRSKLVAFGISQSADKLSSLADSLSGVVNQGAKSFVVNPGGSAISIPAGWYDGTGTVTVAYDWYKIEKGDYGTEEPVYSDGIYTLTTSTSAGCAKLTFYTTKAIDFVISVRGTGVACTQNMLVSKLDQPFTSEVGASDAKVQQTIVGSSSAWTEITYSASAGEHVITFQANKTGSYFSGKNFSIKLTTAGFEDIINGGVSGGGSGGGTNSYTVEAVSGASYGFALNSSGYYESGNKGKHSTAAVCKVVFNMATAATVTISVINYAESRYDYGLLSNIDTTLTTSEAADSSGVHWNGRSNNSSSVQTVSYDVPEGEHFIYIKFRKDNSASSNNDSLQFKVNM